MKRHAWALPVLAIALSSAVRADVPAVGPRIASALESPALRAQHFTMVNDFDAARKELALGSADDPDIALERARLALYEADCDGAVTILKRPELAKSDEGAMLADISRGCARVTAATVVEEDRERGVFVRYQDEADRTLTPLLVDTIVRARDALTRDLGASWPKPTRVIVVRDLLSLSAMTGLPYESAQTTGTVAVAKWGRVTLLSPRASIHGYSWRDTVAHELTHLAVTRATVDRAPLWLQEGVAKREEVRWREPGPFDDRPSSDAISTRGIELKLDLPLDRLGPSIAMLPSADAALVAFSEVTSFVRYLASNTPAGTLERLFAGLHDGKSVDQALEGANPQIPKQTLRDWDTRWRAYLASKPKETLPPSFGLGDKHEKTSVLRDLRDKLRLAELLIGRNHPAEALTQLDQLKNASLTEDPSFRYVRGRALEALGRGKEAEPLFGDPKETLASYGPWWSMRGGLARTRGDEAVADSSFGEAMGDDPFDVEAACEGRDPARGPKDSSKLPLCETARARREPGLGQD
jgi:hypothetical protein